MIVRDIMTANPRCVEVTDEIDAAIEVLYELDVRHVPVVDGGVLVGMLSDRDLRTYRLPTRIEMSNPNKAEQRRQEPVSDIMHADVQTVGAEDSVSEIIRLMIDHKFGAVPVVDELDGRLVGIVSYLDVLTAVEDLV